MPSDRMYRVLVLGGIALVGGSACGGNASVEVGAHDGGAPSKAHAQVDASNQTDADFNTGFPSETNASVASNAASEGGTDASEGGDAAPDARPDAANSATCPPYEVMTINGCFPSETQ